MKREIALTTFIVMAIFQNNITKLKSKFAHKSRDLFLFCCIKNLGLDENVTV